MRYFQNRYGKERRNIVINTRVDIDTYRFILEQTQLRNINVSDYLFILINKEIKAAGNSDKDEATI